MTTESNPKETFGFYHGTSVCACSHQCWPVLVLIPNPVINQVTKPWLQNFGKFRIRTSSWPPARTGLGIRTSPKTHFIPSSISDFFLKLRFFFPLTGVTHVVSFAGAGGIKVLNNNMDIILIIFLGWEVGWVLQMQFKYLIYLIYNFSWVQACSLYR